MVYSYGGKMDKFVTDEPVAYVVNSLGDCEKLGITPSCLKNKADDYNFILAKKSFGLILHGTQPKTAMAMTA